MASAEVVFGQHFNIAGRDVYEDRVETRTLITQAGHRIAAALVADGVGGQAQGERAAQIAVDATFWYLENGEEAEVPSLLKRALAYANSKVYQAGQESGTQGMSTTAALAVVVNGERLYIANVGDSAIFLYRRGKLTKLTRDHTFANIKVWRGEMSEEQASQHPKAEVVLRALGLKERVRVDVGFHVGTEEYREANARGETGLPLKAGDAILVCSDGLIKDSPDSGTPLVSEREMIQVLGSDHGDRAARTLIAFAMGRNPSDNVSAATIHISPEEAPTKAGPGPRSRLVKALTLLLGLVALVAVGALGLRYLRGQRTLAGLTVTATESAETTSLPPPTPSSVPATEAPTEQPLPTEPLEGSRMSASLASEGAQVTIGEILLADREPLIINLRNEALQRKSASALIANPETTLALTSLSEGGFRTSMELGGRMFVYVQALEHGGVIRVEPTTLEVHAQASCMSVDPVPGSPASVVSLTCYQGDCGYVPRFGEPTVPIDPGDRILLDTNGMVVLQRREVDVEVSQAYLEAYSVLNLEPGPEVTACLRPFVPPTPEVTEAGEPDPTATPEG